MRCSMRRLTLGLTAGIALMLVAQVARAQFPIVPSNPYLPAVSNPYLPTVSAQPAPYYPPYSPYYNPYLPFYSPYSSTLMGQADVMRAYGSQIVNQEQARILRQQYYQAKLDTAKRKFDLEMYIRANTPTFTEEQNKIRKHTLDRLRTNSSPAEIMNGQALNYVLDDLRKFPGKTVPAEDYKLPEEVLLQLNVAKGNQSLGLLRNSGKITWPTALLDVVPTEKRKDIEIQTQSLVENAAKGRVDTNLLRDLNTTLEKVRADLLKRVNDLPGNQYLTAKRFLNDFEDARSAVEKGEATTQLKYQDFIKQEAKSGGVSTSKVVQYMVQNGLRFASATSEDESAYRALHSAISAYDLALNTQYNQPETKDQP